MPNGSNLEDRVRPLILAALLLAAAAAQAPPKYLGHTITITASEMEDEFFPKGPASICVDLQPKRQCYTAPRAFGRDPAVEIVQVDRDTTAMLFSAQAGGVSGWSIHFALLQPGDGEKLENLFRPQIEVSNQSEHAIWDVLPISRAKIFVTADYIWGPGEGHYATHRYIVSSYVRFPPNELDDRSVYHLADQYMTARKYDPEKSPAILTAEKPEVLARLGKWRKTR